MAGQLNPDDIMEVLRNAEFPKYAAYELKQAGKTKRGLSATIGRGKTYLQQQLNSYNPSVGLLMLLTQYLHINMFEYFINQLPDNLRVTRRETALQQQINDMQKQIDSLAKERDLLMQIVMKK